MSTNVEDAFALLERRAAADIRLCPLGDDVTVHIFAFVGTHGDQPLAPADVTGMLECPVALCPRLLDGPTIGEVRRWPGVRLVLPADIADSTSIWTPAEETYRFILPLLGDPDVVSRWGTP